MEQRLIAHPDHPPAHPIALTVAASRPAPDRLRLRYRLTGALGDLIVPSPKPATRCDGLWQTTCFEAFIQSSGSGYTELNLAPSGDWAAYCFDDYRAGMASPEEAQPPALTLDRAADWLELEAEWWLGWMPGADLPWRIGISVVVEQRGGAKSYWALAHEGAKPDFHDPRSFTLSL